MLNNIIMSLHYIIIITKFCDIFLNYFKVLLI